MAEAKSRDSHRATAPKHSSSKKAAIRRVEIERADNGGYTVTHHFKDEPSTKTRPYPMPRKPPEVHVFADFEPMAGHLADAFGHGKGKAAHAQEPDEEEGDND